MRFGKDRDRVVGIATETAGRGWMRRANFCRWPSDPIKLLPEGACACSPWSTRMGKRTTLLEGLCGHALSLGAQSIDVEHKDCRDWVFANQGGRGIGIA